MTIKSHSSNLHVFIGGQKKLKNALIGYFLESEIGAACQAVDSHRLIIEQPRKNDGQFYLLLWDYFSTQRAELLSLIRTHASVSNMPMMLFDVDPHCGIEPLALRGGVKGFFYIGDPPEAILKGIQFVMDGELWVSRKTLESYILQGPNGMEDGQPDDQLLTDRQKEILRLIHRGAKNSDIADELCISTHTVKAHIYNLFKKINVTSRLQAAKWVAENLPEITK